MVTWGWLSLLDHIRLVLDLADMIWGILFNFLTVRCLLTLLTVDCHGQDHLCSVDGKPVINQVGHHTRARSNQPIFGMLTQPIPHDWRREIEIGQNSFIESSNVDYLQAAGARVVPIDYRLDALAL